MQGNVEAEGKEQVEEEEGTEFPPLHSMRCELIDNETRHCLCKCEIIIISSRRSASQTRPSAGGLHKSPPLVPSNGGAGENLR